MDPNYQKIQLIKEALQMQDQVSVPVTENPSGFKFVQTITGQDRADLVTEYKTLLLAYVNAPATA
jgi:hypothetical protein